jgi:hypothetical protein
MLELFCTAACFLQKKYEKRLRQLQGSEFRPLPDLYSERLGIPAGLAPEAGLAELAFCHRRLTGAAANWAGTYEHALNNWLRRRQRDTRGADHTPISAKSRENREAAKSTKSRERQTNRKPGNQESFRAD